MEKVIAAISLACAPAGVGAQEHQHQPGASHSGQQQSAALQQSGQATFAAIQEAVGKLEADPRTDWSKVSVERLRRHLVDMENVMTLAAVEAKPVDGGARFIVTGAGPGVGSIQRMIAGHSVTMDGSDSWKYTPTKTAQGGILEVTSTNAADVAKIRALGFAGLMARGNHHQAHHYGMLTGNMNH